MAVHSIRKQATVVILFNFVHIYISNLLYMKIRNLLLALFVLCVLSIKAQSTNELEARNGFKDIKLATNVNQYDGLVFEKEVDDVNFGKLQVYVRKKDQYTAIGSIAIDHLEVRVYNGEVYQIQVIIPKDPKMYGGLKKSFGPPKFSIVTNDYFWAADSLKLLYRSYGKNQLELLYHSVLIDRKLEVEKDEEIDDIASDF